jgi:hypothetical protein
MGKLIKVVMLPTQDKNTGICLNKVTNQLYNKCYSSDCTSQYVYITVSQEIEPFEKCWVYDSESKSVFYNGRKENTKGLTHTNFFHKIVGSNDTKLTNFTIKGEADYFNYDDGLKLNTNTLVPKLNFSFLKQFVANPTAEFEVEYQADWDNLMYCEFGEYAPHRLKLNKDNTISVNLVKERGAKFTLAEVETLMQRSYDEGYATEGEVIDIEKWIDKTLKPWK